MKTILILLVTTFAMVALSGTDASAQTPVFQNANKFTLTTNGLKIEDTLTGSPTVNRRLVYRKGQFHTITRGTTGGTFELIESSSGKVIIRNKSPRTVRIVGTTAAADASGDATKIAAIDLWNQ